MFLLILVIIVLVVLLIYVYLKYNDKQYEKYIFQNSKCLKNLLQINEKYKFYDVEYLEEEHIYDNQNFYDAISCEDYLIYQLQYKKYIVEKQIRIARDNEEKYKKYCAELDLISKFGEYEKENTKLNHNKILRLEKLFFKKSVLNPITNYVATVDLYCSTINGRIYCRKQQNFYSKEIIQLIRRLNNKNREFYNDRGIWDAICRVERGRVSNKMRFSIYERDGYRCRICGRSQSQEYLEIDHIKPIAKGGKSTYDNLQTLCRSCNKYKGDTY